MSANRFSDGFFFYATPTGPQKIASIVPFVVEPIGVIEFDESVDVIMFRNYVAQLVSIHMDKDSGSPPLGAGDSGFIMGLGASPVFELGDIKKFYAVSDSVSVLMSVFGYEQEGRYYVR